jgi:hypothetical protein
MPIDVIFFVARNRPGYALRNDHAHDIADGVAGKNAEPSTLSWPLSV